GERGEEGGPGPLRPALVLAVGGLARQLLRGADVEERLRRADVFGRGAQVGAQLAAQLLAAAPAGAAHLEPEVVALDGALAAERVDDSHGSCPLGRGGVPKCGHPGHGDDEVVPGPAATRQLGTSLVGGAVV